MSKEAPMHQGSCHWRGSNDPAIHTRGGDCRTCGCVTHWEPLQPTPGAKHGVNLGNFDPELIASVRVRRFDGANTWKFFDEP